MAYEGVKTIELKKAIRVIMMASLLAALVFASIAEAGLWSSPSMVTDPAFCGLGTHGCPSISGDGSKVAFEGYVGEDTEIFVISSDGTGLMQLTDNTEDDWAPSISGDGSKIVFQRSPSQLEGPIKSQIFVINSDGTELTQLTDDSERSFMFPSISDNGEKTVFWSAFWTDPESEVDFEYEIGISLVSYLADTEDENDVESTFPVAMLVGGILSVAVGVMVIFYLKGKKPRKL